MVYRGTYKGGVVVLQGNVELSEGQEVEIVVSEAGSTAKQERLGETGEPSKINEALLKLAGKARHLPSDIAENHDHYLYGTPKRCK